MKPQSMVLPTREAITDQQIDSVLSIMTRLENYLIEGTREIGAESPELDGGVKSSAVSTFIRACNRLDVLLEDTTRWELSSVDELFKTLTETHRLQQTLFSEQVKSVKELRRPSYQLRPTLAIIEGGYMAFFGDITQPGKALIGRGKTPKEALEDFDSAFERTPDEQFIVISEQSNGNPPPTNE